MWVFADNNTMIIQSVLEDLALLYCARLLILLEFTELNSIELNYVSFLRILIGYGRVTCAYDGTPEKAS